MPRTVGEPHPCLQILPQTMIIQSTNIARKPHEIIFISLAGHSNINISFGEKIAADLLTELLVVDLKELREAVVLVGQIHEKRV